jgi:hypothetical protein
MTTAQGIASSRFTGVKPSALIWVEYVGQTGTMDVRFPPKSGHRIWHR